MSAPFVSVIMSVYNTKLEFLKESIQSILNQSYGFFEFIIIDDASTTTEIENTIRGYGDKRIIFVKNQSNYGLTKSLNIAIDISKGQYIARMDADDISLNTRLEKQVRFMEGNQDIGVVGANAFCFGEYESKTKWPETHEQIHARMLLENPMVHSSVMIRASLLKRFSYDESHRAAQDYELWSRLIWKSRFQNISEPLLKYRVHKNQVTKVSKNSQCSSANYARLNMLSKLIDIDDETSFLFLQSCSSIPSSSIEEINEIRSLYLKLIEVNKQKRIFNSEELRYILSRNFDRILYVYARDTDRMYRLRDMKGLGGKSSMFTIKKYLAPIYPVLRIFFKR